MMSCALSRFGLRFALIALMASTVCIFVSASSAFAGDAEGYEIVIRRDLFEHHRPSPDADIELTPTSAAEVDLDDPGLNSNAATLDQIRGRPLRLYFVEDFGNGLADGPSAQSRQRLLTDLRALHTANLGVFATEAAVRKEAAPDFSSFDKEFLQTAIKSLTFQKLMRKPLIGTVTLADWSLDDLLKNLEIKFLKKQQGGFAKIARYLKLNRLSKGTVRNSVILLTLAGVTYHFQDSTGMWVALLLLFQEPMREMSGALTGWIRRPLGQLTELLDYRTFGNNEARLSQISDQIVRRFPPPKDESAESLFRPANKAKHGMDFAGTTPEDQEVNFAEDRQYWIELQKHHNKLLTQTQKWGRRLQLDIQEEEMESVHLVTSALDRREQAVKEQNRILNEYTKEILSRVQVPFAERLAMKDRLISLMRQIRDAHDFLWKDPFLPKETVEAQYLKIRRAERGLMEMQVTALDRRLINEEEIIRHEASAVLVMTLVTNERRLAATPEENRSLPAGLAQQEAAEVRKAFGLQKHVDEWQILTATVLRRMGRKKNQTLDDHIARSKSNVCLAFNGVRAAAE